MTEPTDTVVVVGVAVVAHGRVLAARRTHPAEAAGRWELPGGKVEPGEQLVAALHREIVEELGVSIRLGAKVPGPVAGGWPLGERYLMHVWLAEVVTDEPRPIEDHDAVRLLPRQELYAVPWLPADLPVVRAVEALLTG